MSDIFTAPADKQYLRVFPLTALSTHVKNIHTLLQTCTWVLFLEASHLAPNRRSQASGFHLSDLLVTCISLLPFHCVLPCQKNYF